MAKADRPRKPTVGAAATGAAADAADEQARELAPGTLLARRYEVRARLGSGGMGAVYRVLDRERRKDVALKVVLPSLLKREDALLRFEQEAEIMLGLAHPGIVRVFDVGRDAERGLRFYTMELLEGLSLRAWLERLKQERRQVDPDDALEIVRQLLEALRYAHRTTVHRDLKPENVFLVGEGGAARAPGAPLEVKVLDFGIAKVQSASDLTSTAHALGTAYYMAPEQQSDAAKVDQRADLFSVSVILYEMLTGRLPVGSVKPPSERRSSLPREIDTVVMRGLEPEPEARPDTAERLLGEIAELRALVAHGPRRAPALSPAALGVGAVLLLASATVGALMLSRSGPPPPPATGARRAAPSAPVPAPVVAAAPTETARVEILEPPEGLVTREESILVRGRAQGPGVAEVRVNRVPAELAPDGRFEIRVPAAAAVEVVALAKDGRTLAAERRGVAIDRDPPQLVIDGGRSHVTREERLLLTGSVEDAHPEPRVTLDGVAHPLEGGKFAIEVDLKGRPERAGKLKARDRAGNEREIEVRVARDTTAPQVAEWKLTVDEVGTAIEREGEARFSTNADEVYLRGRVADAHPAALLVNGQRVESDAEGVFGTELRLAVGRNDFTAEPVDWAGNRGRAVTFAIERDDPERARAREAEKRREDDRRIAEVRWLPLPTDELMHWKLPEPEPRGAWRCAGKELRGRTGPDGGAAGVGMKAWVDYLIELRYKILKGPGFRVGVRSTGVAYVELGPRLDADGQWHLLELSVRGNGPDAFEQRVEGAWQRLEPDDREPGAGGLVLILLPESECAFTDLRVKVIRKLAEDQ